MFIAHRRSLVSAMEASPCVRIEMARTLRFKQRRPFYFYYLSGSLANPDDNSVRCPSSLGVSLLRLLGLTAELPKAVKRAS